MAINIRQFFIILVFLIISGSIRLDAAGPTLQHQPPTGLEHNTPGVSVKPLPGGGNVISKTTTETKTSADGKTTTTTVTKTKQTHKDGSSSDATETKTEIKTTAKDKNGKEYVSEKTSTTVITKRETDKKKETSTTSTSSGHTAKLGPPSPDGGSEGGESRDLPYEKLSNGPTGLTGKTWEDDEGNTVEELIIPTGEGVQVKRVRTKFKNGSEHTVITREDGTSESTYTSGKKKKVEYYDKNGKLQSTHETDEKGVTTHEYTDKDGNQVTEVTGKDGKTQSKFVKEKSGNSYEIRFLKGKPWKIIQYDPNGNKIDENIIEPKDRKRFKELFGDDLSMNSLPGAGETGIGREVFAGMGTPVSAEPDHPSFDDHPHEV